MLVATPAKYLFLVIKVHLPVGHLPAQSVYVLAEVKPVFSLIRGFIQLLGQVEVLAVQFCILLRQSGQLLLQICYYLHRVITCKDFDIYGNVNYYVYNALNLQKDALVLV